MRLTALSCVMAASGFAGVQAATTNLLGTELSLRTIAQASPTSQLFVTSFPATATVRDDAVEFPDVESLFDPATGVPPGFANSLVDVAIDAGRDFIEIDFDNTAPFTRYATGFQNTYVFTFDSSVPVEILSAVIDESVTTLGLDASRVTFVGDELFVNVQSLAFNTSTFARIVLTAEGGPGVEPEEPPGVIPAPSAAFLLPTALAAVAALRGLRRA